MTGLAKRKLSLALAAGVALAGVAYGMVTRWTAEQELLLFLQSDLSIITTAAAPGEDTNSSPRERKAASHSAKDPSTGDDNATTLPLATQLSSFLNAEFSQHQSLENSAEKKKKKHWDSDQERRRDDQNATAAPTCDANLFHRPPLHRRRKKQQRGPQQQPNHRAGVVLVDRQQKLLLTSAPKAGATVATQLFFKHVGVYEAAMRYDRYWIHKYRVKVFRRQPRHQPASCAQLCSADWLCLKILRSPLDRIVSSYIHTLRFFPERFPELVMVANQSSVLPVEEATFGMFVQALERRATHPDQSESFADDHFMPQRNECDDVTTVQHIPLEALTAALAHIYQQTHGKGIIVNASSLTSGHYISQNQTAATSNGDSTSNINNNNNLLPDATILPPPSSSASGSGKGAGLQSLPYAAYFVNPHVNVQVCRLLCADLQLYGSMCSQLLARDNTTFGSSSSSTKEEEAIRSACQKERARVVGVCGASYDFFS